MILSWQISYNNSPKIFIKVVFPVVTQRASKRQWLSWQWHPDPSSHAPGATAVYPVYPRPSPQVLGTATSPTATEILWVDILKIIGPSNISSKTSGKRRYNPQKQLLAQEKFVLES